MNYLSHARDFLERPWALAGSALPDWLSAFDRKAKLRSGDVPRPESVATEPEAEMTVGLARHFVDDAWFHTTDAFHEVRGELTRWMRTLDGRRLLRSSFFAHLLLEILLDATVLEDDPGADERYYAAVGEIDPEVVEQYAARLSPVPLDGFADLIRRFRRVRIFDAYSEDAGVVRRLESVGHRVGLPSLPEGMAEIVSACRPLVRARAGDLLRDPRSEPR